MKFLTIDPTYLASNGYHPAESITAAWFGASAYLDAVPADCTVKVTGRSQYKLFVNGEAIHFGPLRTTRTTACYDTLDLAPYLKAGLNKLVFQVLSYPEHPTTREQSGPNYCYGDDCGPGIAMEGMLGDLDLSDALNWRIYLDPSISFNSHEQFLVGSSEEVDGRIKAENPFLKENWQVEALPHPTAHPESGRNPYGELTDKHLLPRPIPLLYRKARTFQDWEPLTVPASTTTTFVINAVELTTAYFRIGFSGGRDAVVKMTYAESYFHKRENAKDYKGVRDDTTGFIKGVYNLYMPSGAENEVYEPFLFRTFRFVEITVTTAAEPLTITPLPFIETAYPLVNDKRPEFTDPMKERLYDVALRTLQLCMHDTYEDCPYYEQLMYTCDSRLEMLFTYACSSDPRLPARGIDLFAASLLEEGQLQSRFPSQVEQMIPSFSLYFILMLEDYGQATGDWQRNRKYIPIAERIVESFLAHRCEDGLLAPLGRWDFFDWTKEWDVRGGVPTAAVDGESTLQNLQFIFCTQALCRLLERYGQPEMAAYYRKETETLQQIIRSTLWDAEKGLFREGPDTPGEFSQHTQVYAVLTGLISGEEAKVLMDKVLTDKSLIQCSFVQKFYLFRALEMLDMYDRTEPIWDAWKAFLDLHLTTFPETPYDPRSDCHGWAALPLYEFRKK